MLQTLRMSFRADCALVFSVLALSACGGGSTPAATSTVASTGRPPVAQSSTAASPTPGACSLLTAAQVSAAVGATVGAGRPSTLPAPLGGRSCILATASVPVRTFQVTLRTSADITVAGQSPSVLYAESVAQAAASQGLVVVAGVGDKAEIGRSRAFVLKGDTYMTTDVGFGTSATAHAALVTLTTAAAAKL